MYYVYRYKNKFFEALCLKPRASICSRYGNWHSSIKKNRFRFKNIFNAVNMNIKRIIPFIGLCVLTLLNNNCKKSSPTCHYASVPNSLILQFKKNGQILSDSILSNVKLSYFLNGGKKYVSDFSIATDTNYLNMGFMGTRNIGTISNGNINTFYIEYPNGWDIDSVYVQLYSTFTCYKLCLY